MDQAQAANPRATVEVWAFDEHRLGLKPITCWVWARKDQRPIARRFGTIREILEVYDLLL